MIAEWCQRRQLFVIDEDGQHLVPAFLLDETLSPRPELTAISTSSDMGDGGWSLWSWLATPSAWFGGAVPAGLVRTEPVRVAEAVRRAASNAA